MARSTSRKKAHTTQYNVDQYLNEIKAHYSAHADAKTAAPMKKYMREQFEFLGIKTPETTKLHKQFVTAHGWPSIEQLIPIAESLWQWPEREYQYLALRYVDHFEGQLTSSFLDTIEGLVLQKSWWDTVDEIAIHAVGDLFARYPVEREPYLDKWRSHDSIWLRRTTLLFQLSYKEKTDADLLFTLIEENLGSREFFINKAIGWALREYSKTEPNAVTTFVNQTQLSALSRREALKWMNRTEKKKE
ncbi:MAG: DNA alkylation repair protein [Cyanobacteria bacterium J06632_3]